MTKLTYDQAKRKYLNDPEFKKLVETISDGLIDGVFTAKEIQEALTLANFLYITGTKIEKKE